ncbi:MAG TPA: hypothetical protein GYA10_02330, partial [Alphaproteobacteria bacterium]|nr:hypothetical protein [Alphaproteobacteria bacterium]
MMAATAVLAGPEGARQCRLFMGEMQRYLSAEAPVYRAVLGSLADFGDENLTWFVRFHGIYSDILRAVGPSRAELCSEAGASADVGYVATLIEGALATYEQIARRYDIVSMDAVDRMLGEPVAAPAGDSR